MDAGQAPASCVSPAGGAMQCPKSHKHGRGAYHDLAKRVKYWPANLATYDDPHERVEHARLDNDEDRAVMDGGVRGVDGDECAGGDPRVL